MSTRNRVTTTLALGVVTALGSSCSASSPIPLPGGQGVLAVDSPSAVPQVKLTAEVLDKYWVRPVVELEEDAFALLVNVAPDGRVSVVYPEIPAQSPLLTGRVAHRFGKVNPSWAAPVFARGQVEFVAPGDLDAGRRLTARGRTSVQQVGGGPGYFFTLVSRIPFRMSALDSAGLFSAQYVGSTLAELEPGTLVPVIAGLARGTDTAAVRSAVARYAGYVTNADARRQASSSERR